MSLNNNVKKTSNALRLMFLYLLLSLCLAVITLLTLSFFIPYY